MHTVKLPTARQTIWAIIIVFIGYAILTSPSRSADVTGNAWGQMEGAFHSITTFFDGLLAQ